MSIKKKIGRLSVHREYQNGAKYYKKNIVTYNGSSYICMADETTSAPTDNRYWTLFAGPGGNRSVINISTNYNNAPALYLTLEAAIAMVPEADRVIGFLGTFASSTGWQVWQFNGLSIDNWSDIKRWERYVAATEFAEFQEKEQAEEDERKRLIHTDFNDEFLLGITDKYGRLIWGLTINGEEFAPKGMPEEVKTALAQIFGNLDDINSWMSTEETEMYQVAFKDQEGRIMGGFGLSGELIAFKGMPEETKANLRKIYKNLEKLNGQIEETSGDNYKFALTDSKGRVMAAFRHDGEMYVPKGIPEDTKKQLQIIFANLDILNHQMHVKETDTYSYAVVDKDGRVMFGLFPDGEMYVPKGIPEDTKRNLENIFNQLDHLNYRLSDDEEGKHMFAIRSNNGHLLMAFESDGELWLPKGMTEDAKKEFKRVWERLEDFADIQKEDSSNYAFSIIDSLKRILFGIEKDGATQIGKLLKLASTEFAEKEYAEWLLAIQDKRQRHLVGVRHDGSFFTPVGFDIEQFKVRFRETDNFIEIYDKNLKPVFYIDANAQIHIQGIQGFCKMENIENDNYMFVIRDSSEKILLGFRWDGKIDCPSAIFPETFDSNEYLLVWKDSHGKVFMGVDFDGRLRNKVITELEEKSEELGKRVQTLENVEEKEIDINNTEIRKMRYDGNGGNTYLGNVALQEPGITDYCIIMMYGQSSSIGFENPAGFDDPAVDGCYMLGNNVWNTSGATLQPLKVGGNVRADGVATGTRQDPIVSTVNSFVTLYKKERPWDKNTKFIACSLGVGGRTVAQLSGMKYKDNQETTRRYPMCDENNLDTRVKPFFQAVKAIADAEGKTISLSAVFWLQGANDYGGGYIGKKYDEWKSMVDARKAVDSNAMGGSRDAYYVGLNTLKEDIFALAKSVFGEQQANRPVFMPYSVCGTYINNAYQTINDATAQLAEDFDDIVQVGPTYVTPDYSGGHLAMNGYRWFGEYCAKALFHVFLKHVNWRPLQPHGIEVKGNQVFIYINPIVPPLRFDKYTIDASYKNMGFTVRMGSVAQLDSWKSMTNGGIQRITDIKIIENCVVLTCGDIEEFTGAVEVSYAGQGESGYGGHDQGAGNLRDSDTWQALYEYREDAGDHGSYESFNNWSAKTATQQEIDDYEAWDSGKTYKAGEKCIYTNTSNNVTYLLTCNRDGCTGTPFSSGTTFRTTTYWSRVREATAEDLANLNYWDAVFASATGYDFGDLVIEHPIEYATPQVFRNNYGGEEVNYKNKSRIAGIVNYHTLDVKGNVIVGKKYPMQNWLLNFYKRIVLA